MKISDIRVLSKSQLTEERNKIKRELFNLRFQRAAGEKIKLSRINDLRKTYARILTVSNQNKIRGLDNNA